MSAARLKANATWNDYQQRILRALTHIQEHLDETLDLEDLARVACFSSFHFHRVFAAMTGETIADHVRRLRLERAAIELRASAKQVIRVALDAGYQAHEPFTRAFKAAYGVSPAEFRGATGPIATLAAPSGVHFQPGIPPTRFNTPSIPPKVMKVISKKIKPMRVAYLRHVGAYENVNQTWTDLIAQLSADQQIRKNSVFIGVGHDNPAVTPASDLRYDVCIAVDEVYVPKKPIALETIAGGDYVVAKNCAVREIKNAFQYLFGQWIARSFRELRPAPSFLVHLDAQSKIKRMKRRVDIYAPLQPRRARKKSQPMTFEVKTVEPQRVAYMRHIGPYSEAFRVWMDFIAHLKKSGLPHKDSSYIGVPVDNPKIISPEKLRYDACVTVKEKYVPTRPLRVRTLAGGDYIVARNCPIGEIAKGYENIHRTWLPQSGRTPRKASSFLMAVDGDGSTPPSFGLTDIYVPLE